MIRSLLVVSLLVVSLVLLPVSAQQVTSRRSFVRAFGEGSVSVRPDQARISFSVITQAPTANDAATKNADQSSTVIGRLRQLLGQDAEVRTASYSLNPNYAPQRDTSAPSIIGYTAINVVEATVLDLSRIGQVIDTGIGAGANRVDGLHLSLRDDESVRNQALRMAGQKARTRAEAIALGLGVRLGAVVSAEEGVTYRPVADDGRTTLAATPIEPSNLQVRGTITLEMEILP